ncbi:MAG: hypothetical protein OSA99_16370, partial [Acidimicrobiales bacterium]|nr:hypothetical protein [Acidimicrobiales bacterium]
MRGRGQGRNHKIVGALLAFLGAVQMLVAGVLPAPVGAAPVDDGTLLGFEGEGDHDVDVSGNIDWASIDPIIAI